MAQRTIFAQVIKLIPRSIFSYWVTKHNADYRVRKLDSWSWFNALLLGQLTGHDSLRSIVSVFNACSNSLNKLGLMPVKRSTLADANSNRTLAVLEDCFNFALKKANQLIPKHKTLKINNNGNINNKDNIWALDSSFIKLCLKLCPWAKSQKTSAGLKLHTAIDINNDIPQFAVITEGAASDYKTAQHLKGYQAGSTLVFDKAYMGYPFLNQLNQNNIFFVTRTKANCKYKVLKSNSIDKSTGLKCDQIVYTNTRFGKAYKGKLRRVSYKDPETNKRFVFLTNRFDLDPITITELYKARWNVEVFFKTIKQNLKIKKFLGNNVNAVKAQILVALIAYVLVQLIRNTNKVKLSITDTMAVISTTILLNMPIKRVLGLLPLTRRHPPDPQLSLFS
jgi:putative transposase